MTDLPVMFSTSSRGSCLTVTSLESLMSFEDGGNSMIPSEEEDGEEGEGANDNEVAGFMAS